MECGLAEWCSEKCKLEHEAHMEECAAAQESRRKSRELSRRQAKEFDLSKFEKCVADGWGGSSEAVRNALMEIASAWVNRGQDAVLLYTSESRPGGRFLPLRFVGENQDEEIDELSIELRYICQVETEEKAKLFLIRDTFEEMEVSPEVFDVLSDEFLVRNHALRDDDGAPIHDFRPRKAVYQSYLAPTEWRKAGEARDKVRGGIEIEMPIEKTPRAADASCWICLEEGDEHNGMPLRRDCACRGSAGFVHLPCAIAFSRQKCETAFVEADDKADCRKAWEFCPNCKQKYGPRLAYDLANAWVDIESSHEETDLRRVMAGKGIILHCFLCLHKMLMH